MDVGSILTLNFLLFHNTEHLWRDLCLIMINSSILREGERERDRENEKERERKTLFKPSDSEKTNE